MPAAKHAGSGGTSTFASQAWMSNTIRRASRSTKFVSSVRITRGTTGAGGRETRVRRPLLRGSPSLTAPFAFPPSLDSQAPRA